MLAARWPSAPSERRTLRERCQDALLGAIADPELQRRFARLPVVRWIARRRAARLFDLCAGFVYSQVLHACVRLRLLERLAEGPRTTEELARDTGLDPSAMRKLLEAARGVGLVEPRSGDRHALTIDGAAYLGNPGLAAMVEHHAMLYRDLADPVALLREGASRRTELAGFWAYDGTALGGGSDYSELMAVSLPLLADDVLDAYPIRRGRVLDVGGGKGALVSALLARAPDLDVTLFDLPQVVALAREALRARGLERVQLVGGDARRDALPSPVDVVILCRILHDHDDDDALSLLVRAREAVAPGGILLVAEPMACDGADPVAAYFSFYFLSMGQGRLRSPAQIGALLQRAGFAEFEERPTRQPLLSRLVVGLTQGRGTR